MTIPLVLDIDISDSLRSKRSKNRMFTVKHITVTGEELLKETEDTVLGFPHDAKSSDHRELTFLTRKGDVVNIDSGDVYVMNENGRTVATYHFGNPYGIAVAFSEPSSPLRASSYVTRNIANSGDTLNRAYSAITPNN